MHLSLKEVQAEFFQRLRDLGAVAPNGEVSCYNCKNEYYEEKALIIEQRLDELDRVIAELIRER